MKKLIAEGICGRKFNVTHPPKNPEEICIHCDKDSCMTYMLYLYAVTHYNNPTS
ncbi:MAG: hypothetical protein NWF07_04955 [Candidatus Bathyarchaeota archaeon]|nr:hypothetical protein [Candidatus Bathyarchaeota archaeon]